MPTESTPGLAGLMHLPAALYGLMVGSFQNAAIYPLPREGLSLGNPKRSLCPGCGRQVRARENIPVLSWILLRGRCAGCGWRIPWRYPFVELLTAGLFVFAAWWAPRQGGSWDLILVWWLVLAGIVVATFVDFDFFEIPDEVSIGGMVVGPIASLLVPDLHAATWLAVRLSEGDGVDRFGALIGSLAGMAAGGGVLYAIGALGSKAFGRDAMGFGDVKLLAAGGAFVGPGGALAALLLGAFVASFFGLGNMVRFACLSRRRARARGGSKPLGRSLSVGRIAARYLPFGPYLGMGIGIVLVDWNPVVGVLRGLFRA
jgi:leader peptidase (prepilin peptidase)/N-methyltransferase